MNEFFLTRMVSQGKVFSQKLDEAGIVSRTISSGISNSIWFFRVVVEEELERDCFA
jgi:hypothetical protein